jgi:hypothetical protein
VGRIGRQGFLDQGAGFGEFEVAEEEQGFVRGGASGAVDFQVGAFVEEVRHGTLIQGKICLQPSDLMAKFRAYPDNSRKIRTRGGRKISGPLSFHEALNLA